MERYEHKLRRSVPEEEKTGGRGLRLGICLLLVAAAFCLKTFAPDTAAEWGGRVLQAIDGDLDYRAVFAAVGDFVTGKNSLEETVAVIRAIGETPEKEAEPVPVSAPEPPAAFEPSGAAEDAIRSVSLLRWEGLLPPPVEPVLAAEPPELPAADAPALPEDVWAEPPALPFAAQLPVAGEAGDGFGWRLHPLTGDTRFHYGADFAAPEGAPVAAVADGEVLVSGSSTTAGEYLILSHGDGWESRYFHCSALYVHGGDRVRKGDVIAAVGQSGQATGPHLHLELIKDGKYLDPLAVLPAA